MNTTQFDLVFKFCLVGFCQPKFYKASAWKRAEIVMQTLVKLGYVVERKLHGKGKYWKTNVAMNLSYADLAKIAYDNGCRVTEINFKNTSLKGIQNGK